MENLSGHSRIILVIEAIEKISRRRAAIIFRVPETTLRDRMNSISSKSDTRNGRHTLTKSEEHAIFHYFISLGEQRFSPRVIGV